MLLHETNLLPQIVTDTSQKKMSLRSCQHFYQAVVTCREMGEGWRRYSTHSVLPNHLEG